MNDRLRSPYENIVWRKWPVLIGIACLFVLDSVFRIRDYSEKDVDIQVVGKIGSYLLMLIAGSYLLWKERRPLRQYWLYLWSLFAYLLFTTTWSASPAYGIACLFSLVSYSMFLEGCIRRYGLEASVSILLFSSLAFHIASIFAYLFIPSLGRISYWEYGVYIEGGRMSGIAGSANNLGRYSCFIGLVSIWHILQFNRTKLAVLSLCFSLLCIALTQNRSSIAVLAIGFWILTYRKDWIPYYLGIATLVVLAAFFLFNSSHSVFDFLSRSGEKQEILTLTGRTSIWSVSLDLISNRPVFGYGFGSGISLFSAYVDEIGFTPSHAHNLALQLLLSGGVFALALFILILVHSRPFQDSHNLRKSLLVYVLINGLFESGSFGGLANISSVALFLYLSTSGLSNDTKHFRRFSRRI